MLKTNFQSHKKALEYAKKTATALHNIFSELVEYAQYLQKNQNYEDISESARVCMTEANQSTLKDKIKYQEQFRNLEAIRKQSTLSEHTTKSLKCEIPFSQVILTQAIPVLKDAVDMSGPVEDNLEEFSGLFSKIQKSLYYWKKNPENNEIHLKKGLNILEGKDLQERSLLGVEQPNDWIENFNIGTIMHLSPIQYEEFTFYGDVIYEMSKKMLVEKIIFASICQFTIATEIRFIEIENNKKEKKKKEPLIKTKDMKIAEIYHLRAIEFACKYIRINCPYINHLISSFHKHYNQNLEIIPEESFISMNEIQSVTEFKIESQQKSKIQSQITKECNLQKKNDPKLNLAVKQQFQKKFEEHFQIKSKNEEQTSQKPLNIFSVRNSTPLINKTFPIQFVKNLNLDFKEDQKRNENQTLSTKSLSKKIDKKKQLLSILDSQLFKTNCTSNKTQKNKFNNLSQPLVKQQGKQNKIKQSETQINKDNNNLKFFYFKNFNKFVQNLYINQNSAKDQKQNKTQNIASQQTQCQKNNIAKNASMESKTPKEKLLKLENFSNKQNPKFLTGKQNSVKLQLNNLLTKIKEFK